MNVPPASTNRSRIANDVASSVRPPISIAPRLSTLTSRLVAGSVPIMRYFNSVSLLRAQHRVSAMKRSLSQTAGHNGLMPPYPSRPRWPLAAGLAAGVVLDALLGAPRRGHPVAAFGRAATALEARDYADSRPRGAAHAAACILAVAVPAALLHRRTRTWPLAETAAVAATAWAVTGPRSLHHEAERALVALS